eukprot:scaffold45_cov337-Pavlova_lutheri.AAC.21
MVQHSRDAPTARRRHRDNGNATVEPMQSMVLVSTHLLCGKFDGLDLLFVPSETKTAGKDDVEARMYLGPCSTIPSPTGMFPFSAAGTAVWSRGQVVQGRPPRRLCP